MSEIELLELPDSDTTCHKCYAEFLDPEDLMIHISQLHKEESETTLKSCQFCTSYFASLEHYALHIRNDHLSSLRSCKYCSRVFDDEDNFRKHESKHYLYVNKSQYSCSHCTQLFNNISELEAHELKNHEKSDDGVFLTECLPMLSAFLNIRALKFLQFLGEEMNYICVVCGFSTPDVHGYIQHLKRKKCKSFVCDICSSVYRSKKSLVKHYKGHPECHLGASRSYKQCMECYKMFDIKMWRDHTKNCKAIKCRKCKIVFDTMYELSKHQTEVHPLTVMLEYCKFCSKEFAGALSLSKHIERAHKNNAHLYKYTCSYCTAIFKHPQKLFAHFYSTHKDIQPYTCKICDKKFKVRKKFTIHIKLDHKSIGHIEYDENYHVTFSDKKSSSQQGSIVEEVKEESKGVTIKENDCPEADNVEVSTKDKLQVQVKTDEGSYDTQTDFVSATETDNPSDVDANTVTRKRKHKLNKLIKANILNANDVAEVQILDSDSSDDEPLVKLRKKVRYRRQSKLQKATWNRKKRKEVKDNKKRFICNICKKYCYTFQNYHNHVALHYKNVTLKCVKCCKTFSSKDDLNEHNTKEHSSSQLTQTLKSLLEKRKCGYERKSEISSTEKFQYTIKKVPVPTSDMLATLKEVQDKLSVQKFIENFTPEEAPKKKPIEINTSVVIKPVAGPAREPLFKMTKCNLSHTDYSRQSGLAMPVRFRNVVGEKHKVTLREVYVDDKIDCVEEDSQQDYQDDTYIDDDNTDRNESIPDVAQEVLLEVTEEPAPQTLYIPHRVVLPKLPAEFKKIRIAHLQAEAPYYKIVKVEDVLNPKPQKKKHQIVESALEKKDIKLPDGTKLVTVNPLAHLLGDTPVEQILERTKNKYYQPKPRDFEVAIAKALLRLEEPQAVAKKRGKKAVNE